MLRTYLQPILPVLICMLFNRRTPAFFMQICKARTFERRSCYARTWRARTLSARLERANLTGANLSAAQVEYAQSHGAILDDDAMRRAREGERAERGMLEQDDAETTA